MLENIHESNVSIMAQTVDISTAKIKLCMKLVSLYIAVFKISY